MTPAQNLLWETCRWEQKRAARVAINAMMGMDGAEGLAVWLGYREGYTRANITANLRKKEAKR